MRTGTAILPLHGGKCPPWLFSRMKKLAREISCFIVSEFGEDELLARLSDPFWFQAFGCVLGFDWHSSGITTTVCGALKEGLAEISGELGFFVAGGKGKTSLKTPEEIRRKSEKISLPFSPELLVRASRLSAKVDSAGVQDGYQLYHHAFFFTKKGNWAVIQQGMNEATGMARRYHWHSDKLESFVNDPHLAVCCNSRGSTLNLVAKEGEENRKLSVELSQKPPDFLIGKLKKINELSLPARHEIRLSDISITHLNKIFLKTYEEGVENYEQLLGMKGVGPATLRSLALIGELIYDVSASRRDPARFSFAHGGKDGIPYPVNREDYDRSIEILHKALLDVKTGRTEKREALRRLSIFQKGNIK
ncbi:MAG: DUF763 domain-containing protein [Candidatus Eremiobacteraeota bacterium]|nr:DUF763 domain-containing protein [Candidatus Eremiobacteraeota bacterium]